MSPPSFVRTCVAAMSGYAPGEQPGAGARVVKLNTNELPFPPSPKVLEAIRELDAEALRKYPDPTATKFRTAAARVLSTKVPGIRPEMIIAGNGSDDILTIATRTFVPPSGVIASPDPSYSLYPVLSQIQDARHVGVAWEGDFQLPINALLQTNADAIYLANPNAPTGTIVPLEQIAALASQFAKLLLVDEAYVDFAPPGTTALSLLEAHPNIVVSRTMSKGYGLAGLRFGYAVANESVIEQMMKVKDSYNCDAISIQAATAAIGDQAYAVACWGRVCEERERLVISLDGLGFTCVPSHANFVLATVPSGSVARDLYHGLKQQGILVRFFDKIGLNDKIRITVGSGQENDALIAGLTSLIEKLKAA